MDASSSQDTCPCLRSALSSAGLSQSNHSTQKQGTQEKTPEALAIHVRFELLILSACVHSSILSTHL